MESRKFFHEYLVTQDKNEETFTTLRKFYHEIFILEQNSRNHESFFYESLELCVICKSGLVAKTVLYAPYRTAKHPTVLY